MRYPPSTNTADVKICKNTSECQMIKYLFSIKPLNPMDVKEEDKSEESRRNHMAYYKSLTKIISDIKEEKDQEGEPAIKSHLDNRIDAMEKDRKRIREMFPDMGEDEW